MSRLKVSETNRFGKEKKYAKRPRVVIAFLTWDSVRTLNTTYVGR